MLRKEAAQLYTPEVLYCLIFLMCPGGNRLCSLPFGKLSLCFSGSTEVDTGGACDKGSDWALSSQVLSYLNDGLNENAPPICSYI